MRRDAPWTIRRTVAWITEDLARRGVDSPRLDAELIVAHALGIDRLRLYMDLERPLDGSERRLVRGLLQRRRQREPMAYLLGHRDFYGRRFEVSPAVLVPRPETEELVERALRRLEEHLPEGRIARALDLGTGSGAIALTLAAEHPELHVTATDLSHAALEVARRNAARLGVTERVTWFQGDLFAPLPEEHIFDIVVSNPPYIAEGMLETLQPEVARWEPRVALAGGEDGLDLLRRIAADAPTRLRPGGWLLLEIGSDQGEAVARLLRAAGLRDVAVHADLSGRERIAEARAPRVGERMATSESG